MISKILIVFFQLTFTLSCCSSKISITNNGFFIIKLHFCEIGQWNMFINNYDFYYLPSLFIHSLWREKMLIHFKLLVWLEDERINNFFVIIKISLCFNLFSAWFVIDIFCIIFSLKNRYQSNWINFNNILWFFFIRLNTILYLAKRKKKFIMKTLYYISQWNNINITHN